MTSGAKSKMEGVTLVDDNQTAGGGVSVQDREAALQRAVSQGQWQHAVSLVRQGVSSRQRGATVLQAAQSDVWVCVSDVLHLGVSPDARDAVFLKAAEHEQWDSVLDLLRLGVSRPARDDVFLRAVQEQRWDCAGEVLELGVLQEKRDIVFSDVVDHGDVGLSSNLIAAGVSPALRDRVLRGAIELGRVSFVVELLRLTTVASISDFVLEAAVSLENWTLVFEAVKLHEELQLSAQQMDAACRAAVSGRQWDCALLLVEHGVRPTQEMVDAVLQSDSDVLERFLGIYPREAMPSAVKRMLIAGAIGSDSADFLPDIFLLYGISDEETEEAFECAVDSGKLQALLVFVSCANRNGQLLKQFCAKKSDFYSQETFEWICQTLSLTKRYVVLSLDIAIATNSRNFVKKVVLCDETSRKVRSMFLQKVCVCDKGWFHEVAESLIDLYPSYRRKLFLMSVRQGCPFLALNLYGKGVSLRDVNFALGVAFVNHDCTCVSDCTVSASREKFEGYFYVGFKCSKLENIVRDYFKKLNKNDRIKLKKRSLGGSVGYFMSTGDEEMFLKLFEEYCEWKEAETGFAVRTFRRAYKAAVKWDREKCFVESIHHFMWFCKIQQSRVATALHGRRSSAYYVSVFKLDTSHVDAAIDYALKKQKFSFVSQTILTENKFQGFITFVLKRVFRKRAWPVFDMLFQVIERKLSGKGSCFKSMFYGGYGQVFKHCLSRTVAQASDTRVVTVRDSESNTQTVGASDTVTVETSDIATVRDSNTVTVGDSDSVTVGDSDPATVGDSDTVTVGDSDTATVWTSDTTVWTSDTPTVGASNTTVGTSDTTVGTSDTPTVGASNTTVGTSDTTTVGALDTATVGAVRILDKWLRCLVLRLEKRMDIGPVLTFALGPDLLLGKPSVDVLRLAELSSRHACHGLALLLAAVLGADGRALIERVVASHLHCVGHNLVFVLFCYAVTTLRNPATAAVLIKNLPLNAFLWSHRSYSYQAFHQLENVLFRVSSQELIAALRRENSPRWVLFCQLVDNDLAEAEQTLTLCDSSQECVDVFVQYAARSSRWDLVCRYVSEACRSGLLQELLHMTLLCGVTIRGHGDADAGLVRVLLNLVGTDKNKSYLSDVTWLVLPHRRQRAVALAHCFVSLGASAQHRREDVDDRECPLDGAIVSQELQLIKLFHRSGVVSNQRVFQLAAARASNSFGFLSASRYGGRDSVAAVQSYLSLAASCPLSLRDLCRHAVSLSLGGQPGYLQRVQALPVPGPIKEFILFSDLMPEPEQECAGQTESGSESETE